MLILEGGIVYCTLNHEIMYFHENGCLTIELPQEQKITFTKDVMSDIMVTKEGKHKHILGKYLYKLPSGELLLTNNKIEMEEDKE